jgi:hypothetical protein
MLGIRNHKIKGMRPVDFMVEFRTSSPRDFCKRYNIIINEDGTVYDLILKCRFSCVYNWANNFIGAE